MPLKIQPKSTAAGHQSSADHKPRSRRAVGRGLDYEAGVLALTPDGQRPEAEQSEGRAGFLTGAKRAYYVRQTENRIMGSLTLYGHAVNDLKESLAQRKLANSSFLQIATDLAFSLPLLSGAKAVVMTTVSRLFGAPTAQKAAGALGSTTAYFINKTKGVALAPAPSDASVQQVVDAFQEAGLARHQKASEGIEELDDWQLMAAFAAYHGEGVKKAVMRASIKREMANYKTFVDDVGKLNDPDIRMIRVKPPYGKVQWWRARAMDGSASGPKEDIGSKYELQFKLPTSVAEASRAKDKGFWGTVITCDRGAIPKALRKTRLSAGTTVYEISRKVDLD